MEDHHVSLDVLRQLKTGSLDANSGAVISAHVRSCVTCSRRFEAVPATTPKVRESMVCAALLVAMALVLASWWVGEGGITQWSVVEAPAGRAATAERRLVSSAGPARLSEREADLIATAALVTEMELGTAPAADERHAAIVAACEALQVGDAAAAFVALGRFADRYDPTGTPLRAIAGYASGESTATIDGLFMDAGPSILGPSGTNSSLLRVTAWLASRTALRRGDADVARELWSRIVAAPGPDAVTRLAEAALAGTLGPK